MVVALDEPAYPEPEEQSCQARGSRGSSGESDAYLRAYYASSTGRFTVSRDQLGGQRQAGEDLDSGRGRMARYCCRPAAGWGAASAADSRGRRGSREGMAVKVRRGEMKGAADATGEARGGEARGWIR